MPSFNLREQNVRLTMARANLSVRETAEQVGIHPDYLSALLRGTERAGPQTRRRVMQAKVFTSMGFDDLFVAVEGGGP